MLHVTTEIGKPGKIERERRHFPQLQNQPGTTIYKPHGRRYIPHGYGMYDEWKPHPQNIQPKYTDSGPDWKSRIKYIADPANPKYPAAEIFETNWKAMRPYPLRQLCLNKLANTYMNSSNEWLLDPGLSNRGMKCHFNGRHQATHTSADEITHSMLFGRGRNLETIDKRNGIGESAPGDKPYKTPEYSSQFHKLGSTLPVIDFGANSPWHHQPDTFVPLKPSLNEPREPFRVKARREEKQSEMMTVAALDEWRPATPLKPEKIDEKK
ncbi:spermatogenesis-associated serine-rich protein 1-like isoform X4 [Dreissena polymorpha]|uniref:spermatogenesis-associated serine-rich protein 1-like isoform X4 n=1 Tax=Dreissena polymorpha TaxID=45954 RepID=UPI002264F6ED|nr:spermatogenesis-associated serine-rich protein 1-like isoform X4 [Dreissena polymorpha]